MPQSGGNGMARLYFGPFCLDQVKRIVTYGNGRLLELTSREFDILEALARNAGQPVDRDTFNATVWKGETVGETTLTTHISAIRGKLARAHPGAGNYIRNVRGRGYQFCEAVRYDAPRQRKTQSLTWTITAAGVLICAAIPVWSSLKTADIEIAAYRKLTTDGHAKYGPLVFDGRYIYFRYAGPDYRLRRISVRDSTIESAPLGIGDGQLSGYCASTGEFLAVTNRSVSLVKAGSTERALLKDPEFCRRRFLTIAGS